MKDDDIEGLRKSESPADANWLALSQFTRAMVEKRGWVDDSEVQAFLDTGYRKANIFDVVLIVAMKTITNYSNHISKVPLDDAFADFIWQAKE